MSFRTVKLGDYINILSGCPFESKLFNDEEGMPVIRIRDVVRGYTKTYYKGKFDKSFIINEGDILVGMDGEFNAARWSSEPALLNQRVCKITSKDKSLFSENYLFYLLPKKLKEIEDRTSFATVKHLSGKGINNIEFPLPPLHIQEQIANTLDKADALRRKDQELLTKYDELAQAIFYDMFFRLKLPEISLKSLAEEGKGTFSNGPFGSDLLTSELTTAGVPVIYIRDIRNGYFKWKSNVFVTSEKADQLSFCNVKGDDLLITKVGDPPGKAAVYPQGLTEGVITQDVIRIRLNQKLILPTYLQFLINSPLGQSLIKPIMQEGTRSRFSLGDFKKLCIPVPDISLQKKFTSIINNLTFQKGIFNKDGKSNNLFNGLLNTYFS